MSTWASLNNLHLNTGKSSEVIVSRRERKDLPLTLDGVERVDSMKILGRDLRATPHVDDIIESCSSYLRALRTLPAHGLPPSAVQMMAEAAMVAKLLNAAPAWWRLASTANR